jgi:hypothetical protein
MYIKLLTEMKLAQAKDVSLVASTKFVGHWPLGIPMRAMKLFKFPVVMLKHLKKGTIIKGSEIWQWNFFLFL